jgi:hypothetical protein
MLGDREIDLDGMGAWFRERVMSRLHVNSFRSED